MTLRVRELTAHASGGVTVLAVEGPAALDRVRALAPDARLAVGRPSLVRLQADGELLDEAICLVSGPGYVELHLHGSPPLVGAVRRALGHADEPPPGGSLEERAERRLATAPCEAAARILLDQADGALRRELERLRAADGRDLQRTLGDLLARGEQLELLMRPPRVVLSGPANAGKSTLFNLLAGRERVVVHPTAGTTRDAIRERVRLGDVAIDLVDTAGARAVAGEHALAELERAGQLRAREAVAGADVLLWLSRGGALAPPGACAGEPVPVPVATCADEGDARDAMPAVSSHDDPRGACETLERVIRTALRLAAPVWMPGAAVPPDAATGAELGAVLSVTGAAERRAALARLLRR